MEMVNLVSLLVAVASAVVSVAAFIVTWREVRRSNEPEVELVSMDSATSVNLEGAHHHFDLTIRNRGIALSDVTAHLVFLNDDHGTRSFELSSPQDYPDFRRGMFAMFQLLSTGLLRHDGIGIKWLTGLKDVRKQKARIEVRSQGHTVAIVPLV